MLRQRKSGHGAVPPEIRHHSEYRTRRFVLEAWDRMDGSSEFAAMGM
jgi:hypothetical protein